MSRTRATAVSPTAPPMPAGPWAIVVAGSDLAGIGPLRLLVGIEVFSLSNEIWLRGPALDARLDRRLAAVPGARRFRVLPDGQLQPAGSRVPKDWLPKGPWEPLRQWLDVELPPARLAGQSAERAPMVLVRSTRPEAPSVLLTNIGRWTAYAVEAPQVRLDRWQFAVDEKGRALIRGLPLPPLPGEYWVERDGIAVPAGWRWSPPLEAAIVRRLFGLEPGDLALWHPDGTWERIEAAQFVRAGRTAVRATADAECIHHAPRDGHSSRGA